MRSYNKPSYQDLMIRPYAWYLIIALHKLLHSQMFNLQCYGWNEEVLRSSLYILEPIFFMVTAEWKKYNGNDFESTF